VEGKMTILERNDTNGVAHLNMNAPERLNALSDEMLAALQSQFDAIKEDASVRAVILSGQQGVLCSHNLKEMTAGRQPRMAAKRILRTCLIAAPQ
jgi:Enoyl-CoA hydratase/carnithine racemase